MRTTLRIFLRCFTLSLALASGSAPAASNAASAPKPGAITIASAGITYFAQAGDTLMSIAQHFTPRRENWVALGKLNNIDKDSNIPIGTGILIPADLLADEPSEAQVVALSGNVTAKVADGVTARLSMGAKVTEGMEISTEGNSFLTIALPDASRVSLPSNSHVKLAKLRVTRYTKSPRTEVMLLRGRVESRVSPLAETRGRFEVRTPQSVAGVRGTHFRVGIVGDSVVNEVLSGRVAIGQGKNPDALLLASGKGSIVDAKSVGPAIDLLPAPQILAPGTLKEYPSAQFALTPIAGASAYHVQISTDRDAQDIIAENRSNSTKVKVDGVKDGEYFMHVSAVDKSGLEGWPRTQAFTLKARIEAPARAAASATAPYVERSDDKHVMLRWLAQPGKKFVVQVARDADFTWLIYTAGAEQPEASVPRPVFGTYYARVQSIDADGGVGPFSQAQPFIVTDQWVINDGNPVKVKDARAGAAH